mmetsp:Transcript_11279/g.30354  ORF Transcript_11279/g.30354 Transcript_11279/m.30354 type:complete len:200 (+) Transcript_11279:70-669(+)
MESGVQFVWHSLSADCIDGRCSIYSHHHSAPRPAPRNSECAKTSAAVGGSTRAAFHGRSRAARSHACERRIRRPRGWHARRAKICRIHCRRAAFRRLCARRRPQTFEIQLHCRVSAARASLRFPSAPIHSAAHSNPLAQPTRDSRAVFSIGESVLRFAIWRRLFSDFRTFQHRRDPVSAARKSGHHRWHFVVLVDARHA